MAFDTEIIDITASPPLEAGARYFARLAYPALEDETQRDHFFSTFTRWAILELCHADPERATDVQPIRPGHFLPDEATHERTLKHGIKVLNQRFCMAHFIAMPALMELRGHQAEILGNTPPMVSNTSALAMDWLGWQGDSQKTLADKWWRPSRPVIHAVCAFLLWRPSTETKQAALNPILTCMLDAALLRKIVLTSEIVRVELPLIKRFKILESDTVRFVVA